MALSVKDQILERFPELEKWSKALDKIVDSNLSEIDSADLKEYGVVDRDDRKKMYSVIQQIICDDKGSPRHSPRNSGSDSPPKARPRMKRAESVPVLAKGFSDWKEMREQFQLLHQERVYKQSARQYELTTSPKLDENKEVDSFEFQPLAAMTPSVPNRSRSVSPVLSPLKADAEPTKRARAATLPNEERFDYELSDIEDDEKVPKTAVRSSRPRTPEDDHKEMRQQFKRMSIMNMSCRMIETRVEMQLKPEHRHRFDDLMKDIGIVNETVSDKLWAHIELTVENDKVTEDEAVTMKQKMKELQDENMALRLQIKGLQEKVKAVRAIVDHSSAL